LEETRKLGRKDSIEKEYKKKAEKLLQILKQVIEKTE